MSILDTAGRLVFEMVCLFFALRYVIGVSLRDAKREAPFVLPPQLPHRTPGPRDPEPEPEPEPAPEPEKRRPSGGSPGNAAIDILLEDFNREDVKPTHDAWLRARSLEHRIDALLAEVGRLNDRVHKIEHASQSERAPKVIFFQVAAAIVACVAGAALVAIGHLLLGVFQ